MDNSWYEALLKFVEEQNSINADQVQGKVLKNILKRNAETEYLRKFLHGQTDEQHFKKNVPLLLMKISTLARVQPKLIPSTAESLEKRNSLPVLAEAVARTQIGFDSNGKAMSLLFVKPELETPCGLKARIYTSSFILSSIANCLSVYYSATRFSPLVQSAFARCIKCLKDHWEEIGSNIRTESREKPQKLHFNGVSNGEYIENFNGVSNGEYIEKCENGNAEAVDLVNVKVGQCYEVVVRTLAVGDVLKVTGFHNNSPQFRFVERENVVLSIDTDKTSEADLLNAITNAKPLLQLGFILTTYSSYTDTSITPVEESLGFKYKYHRKLNEIGPLELRVVKHGTFDALMDFYVSKGASVTQYKTPCCLKSEEAINMLNSGVEIRTLLQLASYGLIGGTNFSCSLALAEGLPLNLRTKESEDHLQLFLQV
ncbi:hypothetical protein DITRI_Ditri01bG0143900 [Diplodiscus trichospermus]